MIGYYLSPSEVGIYAVAALLAQTLTLIPSAVQRVTAPATATLYGKGDIRAIRRVISSTMRKTFLVSVPIALVLVIFGQFFITLLFTGEFLPAYLPLLALLVGHTIFAPFMAIGSTLASIGKVNIPFKIHSICGMLNVVLNILLIPLFGIVGAAASTTVTHIASFVIHMAVIQRTLS